ncbi:MAG TPA: lysylphosphatidylglycerol synthase domain-containing protein [Frankiaceae bacterium]|nr:lysylphosphatidylglycerol synthase domain-containing protein [Frankiaceae bacterium]
MAADPMALVRPRHDPHAVRRALAAALTAAVVVVAFAGVLPRVADAGAVWDLVSTLPAGAVAAVALLTLAHVAAYPLLSMASLPGLRFWPAVVVTQASTAVSHTVPAGGGVGVGVTYAMYAGYGFPPTPIVLSVTTTGVANVVVKLTMPAVAAVLLAVSGDAPGWAWRAAQLGLLLTAGTVFFATGVLTHRRDAAYVVRGVARVVATLRRRDPAAAAETADRALDTAREQARALCRPRGLAILGAAIGSHLVMYALFAACLSAVGAGVGVPLSFAAFAVVRLGLAVPVTPGGVGVAEAGYAAALVASGAAAEPAVAAVLLFRAATYLLPIPLGFACGVAWRRRGMRNTPRGYRVRSA